MERQKSLQRVLLGLGCLHWSSSQWHYCVANKEKTLILQTSPSPSTSSSSISSGCDWFLYLVTLNIVSFVSEVAVVVQGVIGFRISSH